MNDMGNNGDNYRARQGDADAAYRRHYNLWLAAMTPEERRLAQSLGLAKPVVEDAGGGLGSKDIADTPLAAEWPRDIGEAEEEGPNNGVHPPLGTSVSSPTEGGGFAADETVWDAVRRVLAEILCQSDRSLALDCFALTTGLSYFGDSMVELARRHQVTRAAVSKRCVEFAERLGLAPSRAMRSRNARKSYQQIQLRIRRQQDHQNQKQRSKRHAERRRNTGS